MYEVEKKLEDKNEGAYKKLIVPTAKQYIILLCIFNV